MQFEKHKKGQLQGFVAIFLAIILAGVVLGGIFLWVNKGSNNIPLLAGDNSGNGQAGFDGEWANSIVYYKFTVKNKYNATSLGPTVKVFHEKPTDWLIATGSFDTDDPKYSDTFTGSNGTVTINTLQPGNYYAVITLSGYNTVFKELSIPDKRRSYTETLNDYNNAPNSAILKMAYTDTLSVADKSLGTLTNTTTKQTWTAYQQIVVDDDQEYCLDYVTFKESSTYSFATDADSDGEYDEGVEYIKICIADECKVVFDVDKSIDEFSGDDEYKMNFDALTLKEESTLNIVYKVESDKGTMDAVGDADEYLGETENFLDIVLTDCEGTTATINLSG